MAYFARIENDIVTSVLAVPDAQEHRGQEFLAEDLGLGGEWIQTSYTNRIRRRYAGLGMIYSRQADVFIYPQPYPSWTLDSNYDWQAPKPKPDGAWVWNESKLDWEELETATF